MAGDFSKNFYVNSVVSELFTVESQLCSTRTADLFKAFDRERGRPVAVWMLRTQFEPDSNVIGEFTNRLGKLSLQSGAVARIMTAGVDPTGVVFAVIGSVDGYPVTSGNLDGVEAERRFIALCKIVEQMHLSGIACGDLCGSSFWINRSGDLSFTGIMGSFEESGSDAAVPPLDTLAYVAPEQMPGGGVNFYHDVYALGVIGYQLFTKRTPFENPAAKGSEKPTPPRTLNPSAPIWVDEVLLKCLESIPGRRYGTAGSLLAALMEAKERIATEQSSVVERQSRSLTQKDKTDGTVVSFQPGIASEIPEGHLEQGVSAKRLIVVGSVLAILMAILIVGGFAVYKKVSVEEPTDQELVVHREAAGERMRQALDVVSDTDSELNEKRLKFQELAQSDDPLAHDILVRSAIDSETPKIRLIAEQEILARAKRLHFEIAANAVSSWLNTISIQSPPPEYEYALKALNASLPVEGRIEAVQRVFTTNPTLALRILTALVLEADESTPYQKITAQIVSASLNMNVPGDISPEAMLFAHEDVYKEYSQQLLTRLQNASDRDVKFLMDYTVGNAKPQMSAITTMALERKLIDPIKSVFLEPLRDRDSLPEGIPAVLLRAAQDNLSKGDLELIGMWLDKAAEPVLLGICADNSSPELQTEAVEYLAGRGISDQPQGTFIQWIKESAWERRAELAEPLGVTALSDKATIEKIHHALTKLEGFTKDKRIFNILFLASDPRFIGEVLKMYHAVVPSEALVTLLAHPSKEVRLAAIGSLDRVNEVGALNAIIELYNAEVDPDVRKAYSDNLWVIKQRLQGK